MSVSSLQTCGFAGIQNAQHLHQKQVQQQPQLDPSYTPPTAAAAILPIDPSKTVDLHA